MEETREPKIILIEALPNLRGIGIRHGWSFAHGNNNITRSRDDSGCGSRIVTRHENMRWLSPDRR